VICVENKEDKKYDHAEAIRQQIKHSNQVLSGIDTEDKQSFGKYYSKAFMSISSLEAMIAPFGYDSNLKGENPGKMKPGERLSLLRETMEKIYSFLHDHDLFYAAYSSEELGSKDKEKEGDKQ